MAVIHVVGLGPAGLSAMPAEALARLRSGAPVYLRTERHPAATELRALGVAYTALDDVYEQAESWDDVYDTIAWKLIDCAHAQPELVYAVPGHPAFAERSVHLLREAAQAVGYEVRMGAGRSFFDDVVAALGFDPIEGLQIVDAADIEARPLSVRMHLLVVQMYSSEQASLVKNALADAWGDLHKVMLVSAAGSEQGARVTALPLCELDRSAEVDHLTTLYVPPLTDPLLATGEWFDLVQIIARLRAPDGCPWDRAQTHESLRRYALEEAYEVAEAIDEGDVDHLVEELGDLLLQVVLHSQIGRDDGYFTVADVVRGLARKMIVRHPHVFGDAEATSAEQVVDNWERIKRTVRDEAGAGPDPASAGGAAPPSRLDRVKRALPPLEEAVRLQQSAAEVGFDWPDLAGVFAKVGEELNEVHDAVASGDPAHICEEVGDLLYAATNIARRLGIDPERALRMSNAKFRRRFAHMEDELACSGRTFADATLPLLDEFWQNAKRNERS
ncbi:MAG: nucleoside triphosphate pyrophosphohydrolase [Firmicutes bacterium]|nr:nucleoside triphosphate pyrophosphohydrolase [Bacillota bacterium]